MPELKKIQFPKIQIFRTVIFPKMLPGSFLFFLDNLAYLNPQIRLPKGPRNPEIMKIEVVGLSHNKIEKVLIQNEAE